MTSKLIRSANRLRAAVNSRDYREMEQMLDAYRLEVETCWKASATREERGALSTEVTGLLQWARTAMLAARSHSQAKLIQLARRSAYANVDSRERVHLNLDA